MATVEENVEAAVISQLSAGNPDLVEPSSSEAFEPVESVDPDEPYEFEDDFQRKIAALALRDSSFARRTEGLIKPEHFDNEYRATLVAIAQEYFEAYRAIPGNKAVWSQLLKDNIKSKRIRDDVKLEVRDELLSLLADDVSDGDYVVGKVSEFARNQAVQRAMLKSFDLMENGRMDDAQQSMEKAFAVGAADAFQDYDYWEDIERRTQYRTDKAAGLITPDGVSTGIKKIDNLLFHHGWGRRELSAIMGGAKKGKSMALGEFAVRASMAGYNALYVTLEVSSEIIMDRIDANVTGTDMDDLEAHTHSISTTVSSRKGHGKLKVTQFASGSLSPSGLRRIIESYRTEGIIFDLVVVDYADIMAPDHPSHNTIEDSKQIWLGLRAIAFEENAAVLTATQTNRDGFKADTAKAEHAAEDFNKVRIADLIISINRDESEKLKGEARLYFAASRNQAGEYTVQIQQDLSKMKFIKKVLKIM